MPAHSSRPVQSLVAVLLGALLAVGWSAPAGAQAGLAADRAAADRLRAIVGAEQRRIAGTRAGLADAEARLAVIVGRVQRRQAQLTEAQDKLVRARIRLTRLQRREIQARRTLADNLAAAYKSGKPTIVTVVLNSNGFADLLGQVEFLKRVSRRNATILDETREARAAVKRQTVDLERLQKRYSAMARAAIADRERAAAIRGALLEREARQLARRNGAASRLATVRSRIARVERAQAAAARRAAAASSATTAAPTATGSDAVSKVIAAANQIASAPYVYGGGHGGASGGYDCSGSISFALAAAGLVGSPLSSGGFMSWGQAGPGQRITVYANAGHAFMVVDGRRYDTTALSGGGTRWTSAMRPTAGFVARHPPGL